MFAAAQRFRNWREHRPSKKCDFETVVTKFWEGLLHAVGPASDFIFYNIA
jgi:hypothetical protein